MAEKQPPSVKEQAPVIKEQPAPAVVKADPPPPVIWSLDAAARYWVTSPTYNPQTMHDSLYVFAIRVGYPTEGTAKQMVMVLRAYGFVCKEPPPYPAY